MNFYDTHIDLRRHLARTIVPAVCSAWLVWIFFDQLSGIEVSGVLDAIAAQSAGTWTLACLFTWASFAAISGYDPIATHLLGIPIPARRASEIGWTATAISQLAGFGVVTGATVRWLLLGQDPAQKTGNSLARAFRLTLTVSIIFLVALAVVTTAMAIITHTNALQIAGIACAAFASCRMACRMSALQSQVGLKIRRIAIPILALTILDTVFATLVIFILLPSAALPFSDLYLAFLMSLALGMISGLPGGIGPFEICMFALLPGVDPASLAAALVGFRMVYFAAPALLALTVITRRLLAPYRQTAQIDVSARMPARLRLTAPAERDLLTDARLQCMFTDDHDEGWLMHRTSTADMFIGDPFGKARRASNLQAFALAYSRWAKRGLCIYRCSSTTYARARRQGMRGFGFSAEAVITPSTFEMSVPARAGLRRKVRQARKAGVSVNENRPDMADLTEIDAEWTARQGAARGLTTGVFSVALVQQQRLYVAYLNDQPIAFVTFSASSNRWLLDLVRYCDDIPRGVIYLLIHHAIDDARVSGVSCVSLGCVPFAPVIATNRLNAWIMSSIFKRSSTVQGLFQFKQTFAPTWKNRYLMFSSFASGLVAAGHLYRETHKPTAPLNPPSNS